MSEGLLICQNIEGLEEKLGPLKEKAEAFIANNDFKSELPGEAYCSGNAYTGIKDNDQIANEVLLGWQQLTLGLVGFIENDIITFKSADGQ